MLSNQVLEKLLSDWNPHFAGADRNVWRGTVKRDQYLEQLIKLINLRHAIILTGVRRAGKSTLMHQLAGWLIEEKKVPPQNVIYLYLEDVLASPYLKLGAELLESLYTYYLERYNPQGRVYLFLDEVQGVKDFNRWIAGRYERQTNIKFILSGSRRSLIEAEAATVLTGRNVQMEIYPFDFSEYLRVKKIDPKGGGDRTMPILHHLNRYLFEGGFPEIVLAETETEKKAIAAGYYRDTLARDVLIPNHIRNARDVEVLGLQLLNDFTKTHTYNSLGRPNKLAPETVKNYLDYFAKAYLFFESPFFSYKTKVSQDIQKARKIYAVDNGLRNFNVLQTRPDLGQCAENTAFMELKKNSAAISYWQGKKEVDLAVLNPKLSLYNVSYTDEPDERETAGLLEAMKEFKLNRGVVLTKNYQDKQKFGRYSIEFIPLWLWLLAKGGQ